MMCPITDETGVQYEATDKRIKILDHVARLKDGVPNPKRRPMIPNGWRIKVRFDLQQNVLLNEQTLHTMLEQGGVLGLGTFRPIFGRFAVEWN